MKNLVWNKIYLTFFLAYTLAVFTPFSNAVELSSLFSDHMVLQRNHVINISGTAKPNEHITVYLSNSPHLPKSVVNTRASAEGIWNTALPPRKAGGPFIMSINGEHASKTIKDIYIGDVWLASGQSNMDWKLKWEVNNWKEEVKDSNYPLIRYFDVQDNVQTTKQNTLTAGKWDVASPKTSENFSAVAWFFAKKIQQNKGIPIGIIDSTWGGTPAEAWTPANALLSLNGYRDNAKSIIENPTRWDKKIADATIQQNIKNTMLFHSTKHKDLKLSSTSYNDNQWIKESVDKRITYTDIVWLRKTIELPSSVTSANKLTIDLGHYPQMLWVYLNDTLIGEKGADQQPKPFTVNLNNSSAPVLKAGKNVLSIRAANGWDNKVRFGGKPNKMKMDIISSDTTQSINLSGQWRINNTLEGKVPMPPAMFKTESVLYNGMINPLINSPIAGVIWYQGESNIWRASEYADLFKAMINSWRTAWNLPNLPFIYAQLASMHPQQPKPTNSTWAQLREAQTQTLAIPNTAMVVLIDAGEAYDIHPRNKQIVGERMWHAANKLVYGSTKESSGPTAINISRNNNKLIVSYKNVGNGLKANGELLGFEVAGQDGKYYNAKALINGDNVVVWSNNVTAPKSLRYGWADNSPANLYNEDGFPAVPLRLGE